MVFLQESGMVILDERVIGGLDDVEGCSMVYESLSLSTHFRNIIYNAPRFQKETYFFLAII